MQILQVKVKDETGVSRLIEVKVVRAWTQSGGNQLFLHLSGLYGYKTGAPVRNVAEFDLIGDAHQKRLALDWWARSGKALSAQYYKKKAEDDAMRQDAEVPAVEGDFSSLDVIQYIRRPIEKRLREAYTEPYTWYEWFDARPGWWGYARMIEIRGYRYEIVEPSKIIDPATPEGSAVAGPEGQTAEDGGQTAEDGSQKSEVGGQTAEDGGQTAEDGSQKSEVEEPDLEIVEENSTPKKDRKGKK